MNESWCKNKSRHMNESFRTYCSADMKLAAASSSEMYMKESCHV